MGLNKIAKFEKEKKRKKRMEDWVEIYTYSETDCGGAGLDTVQHKAWLNYIKKNTFTLEHACNSSIEWYHYFL